MKLTPAIYDIPEVKAACERAQKRKDETDEDWAVYCDSTLPTRTWIIPVNEILYPPSVHIFDTYEGRTIGQ